jgi:hypothetical protein
MMFCCQNVKDIPTDIRGNADAWFLFAGYPPHDISLIRQYLATRMDKDELWDLYCSLGKYEKLIFSKHSRDCAIMCR